MRVRTRQLAVIASALLASAGAAHAQRPALAGEATYGAAGGALLVHYATTGVDAAPIADADASGVPDFVESVADVAETALDQLVALGFRAPLSDGALGGDARIDIYLRNLVAADGNAGTDSCTANHCIGFVVAENDYAGFNYPSVIEGIQSVVPHEIFHLVQRAYSDDQLSTWDEGTAVWAVEQMYGDGNSDFERFLPSFITRSFRPFERAVGGFGDAYPYGAALWPYFLAHRFEPRAIVDAWEGCETLPFLDAIDRALAPRGSGVDAAFAEFTRWNLFTGARAAGGGYPDAAAWPAVPREAPIAGAGQIFIEGMSARYVPITVGDNPRVAVRASNGVQIAAWIVRDGGGLADGVELAARDGVLSATVAAGGYTLVVTGLSRNTIATAVDVELTPPLADEPADDDGGCSAAAGNTSANAGAIFAIAFVVIRRRRRRS